MQKKYVAMNDRFDPKPIFITNSRIDAKDMLAAIYFEEDEEWLDKHILELPYLSNLNCSPTAPIFPDESR